MATGKRKRAKKVSKGTGVGAKRLSPRLSEVQKVLLGGGLLRNVAQRAAKTERNSNGN